jgi:hypothetical protein
MNQQTKNSLFVISYVFVLTGSIAYATYWIYAPYLFAAGSAGITVCYMTVPYEPHFRLRRLNRMNVFAGILMVVASVFMFMVRNEWVVFLLIAALLQLYASVVVRKEK